MRSPFDLLLPPRCALCGQAGPLACAGCLAAMPLLAGERCARCGRPVGEPVERCRECRGRRLGFASAAAAIAYEDAGRALVHRLKAGALRALAEPAAGLVVLGVAAPAADVLTWVPPHPWRLLQRGCHPPELLARALGRRWGIPAAALLAGSAPRSQRGLDPAARRANVRGAFHACGRPPPRVALVDDVYTTGATVSACATALRRAGAARVDAVTLARAVAP